MLRTRLKRSSPSIGGLRPPVKFLASASTSLGLEPQGPASVHARILHSGRSPPPVVLATATVAHRSVVVSLARFAFRLSRAAVILRPTTACVRLVRGAHHSVREHCWRWRRRVWVLLDHDIGNGARLA